MAALGPAFGMPLNAEGSTVTVPEGFIRNFGNVMPPAEVADPSNEGTSRPTAAATNRILRMLTPLVGRWRGRRWMEARPGRHHLLSESWRNEDSTPSGAVQSNAGRVQAASGKAGCGAGEGCGARWAAAPRPPTGQAGTTRSAPGSSDGCLLSSPAGCRSEHEPRCDARTRRVLGNVRGIAF